MTSSQVNAGNALEWRQVLKSTAWRGPLAIQRTCSVDQIACAFFTIHSTEEFLQSFLQSTVNRVVQKTVCSTLQHLLA